MGKDKLYIEYRRYKSVLNSVIMGYSTDIQWGFALSERIWKWLYSPNKMWNVIASVIKNLLFDNFRVSESFANEKNKVLFFYIDMGRKDFDKMYLNVKKIVKFYDEIVLYRKRKLNVKQIIKIVDAVNFYRQLKGINNSLAKVYFAMYAVGYKDFIDEQSKKAIKYNLLTTFCDHHEEANIMAQVYKLNNVRTATLQHGIYTESEVQPDSCIAYEAFISDFILVWGGHTRSIFLKNKIIEERIIEVGSPKYIDFEFPSINEITECERNCKQFGVILSGLSVLTFEGNVKLIRYANKVGEYLDYKYIIRPHPFDRDPNRILKYVDKKYFIGFSFEESIAEYSKTVEFSIVYLSSVYYELMYLLKPVFCYSPDDRSESSKRNDMELLFENNKELMRLIIMDKNKVLSILNENREYYLGIGNIKEKYSLFFQRYLH